MSAVSLRPLISVAEYLEGELVSRVKHEYLGGVVYSMAGARNVHNRISGNAFASLHARLRGKPCQPYDSDTKIRIRAASRPGSTRFYYPDVSVVCRENPQRDSYQDEPVVVVEVLSQATRRTDEGEKLDGYLSIPSLRVYLLVEQDRAVVTLYRKGEGDTVGGGDFEREVHHGLDAVIPLPEVGLELTLAEVYEGVEFEPEPPSDDER